MLDGEFPPIGIADDLPDVSVDKVLVETRSLALQAPTFDFGIF